MEPRELRIGNKIFCNKEQIEVCINDFGEWEDNESTYSLDPIPLTKDYLIAFGFNKMDGEYGDNGWFILGYIAKLHDVFCSVLYNIESGACILSSEICTTDEVLHEIQGYVGFKLQSVHQLQNLYFAITNEELTTKTQ